MQIYIDFDLSCCFKCEKMNLDLMVESVVNRLGGYVYRYSLHVIDVEGNFYSKYFLKGLLIIFF